MRLLRTAQLLFVCFRSRQHPCHDKAPLVPLIIDNRPDPVASGRTPIPSSSSSSSFGVVGDSEIMERPEDDRSENNRVDTATTPTPTSSTSTTPSPVVVSERVRELLRREAGHDPTAPYVVRKRRSEDVLPWDDYFLAVAALSAKRSKDPSASGGGGACIVDAKRRVVGVGYDGLPRGCDDDLVPWGDDENDETTTDFLRSKHAYVVKAEVNAVLNRCSADVDGATMYVLRYPCHESAKIIVQAGVAEVVWPESDDDASTSNEDTYRASRVLFEMAGVRTRAHRPKRSRIVLDLGAAAADADATSNDDDVVDDAARERDDEHRPTPEQERRRREKAKALLLREAGYDPDDPEQRRRQRPSSSYLSWDDYFLALSFLSARRSKDPNTQVGACLVNRDRRVVGIGYNGFPRGCDDDHLPWGRVAESPLRTKYPYVVHAEVNALLNKGDAVLDGATLYVALFPCNDCAKTLVQAGVREIVYLEDKYHDTDSCRASRIMLGMAGVRCRRHTTDQTRIVLDLTRDADDSNDAT